MMKERNSSIELLRILCAMGVICLHYNNPHGFSSVALESLNQLELCLLEVLSCSAVNVYILITGYFLATTSKRSIDKPINLLMQVIFYHLLFFFIYLQLGETEFKPINFVALFLPTNWFVILYVSLYIISPYLNIIVDKLGQKEYKLFLVVIISLFCGWNFFCDLIGKFAKNDIIGLSTIGMYGSQGGCTIVNFSIMYLIGAYIKKNDVILSKNCLIRVLGGGTFTTFNNTLDRI